MDPLEQTQILAQGRFWKAVIRRFLGFALRTIGESMFDFLRIVESIGEQEAVEVVDFVLQERGVCSFGDDRPSRTGHVDVFDGGSLESTKLESQMRNGSALFPFVRRFERSLDDPGIDQRHRLRFAEEEDSAHSEGDPDLRSAQRAESGLVIPQAVERCRQPGLELGDLGSARIADRLAAIPERCMTNQLQMFDRHVIPR